MMDAATIAACEAHIGRSRTAHDSMAPEPAQRLARLLNAPAPDAVLPPTWHWAYFHDGIAPEDQGHDLHEKLGLFLPPAPFARRMWAAGDVRVLEPLELGRPATCVSTVETVEFKTGRSGEMCFVTVRHRIAQGGPPRIDEVQTIVYRDRGAPEPALRASGDPVPEGYFVHPDGQLFFYSAVTHNGHRIHWDRAFCRETEGYPDLVVHGPLMATELCDAVRGGIGPCRFAFQARAPVFVTSPVRIMPQEGRIERSDGVVSMTATFSGG